MSFGKFSAGTLRGLLKEKRGIIQQLGRITQETLQSSTFQGNTAITSRTLTHGQKPTANTPGVNGQIWYAPDANLYVCVDAYSANAYYNWKRVQLVNL
jgi:hypothetical protein